MVSNEDRDSAFSVIAEALYGPAYGKASKEKANRVLAALVSHGWGPKPTVSAEKISEFIVNARAAAPASFAMNMSRYLRECGIEVTQ